MALIEHGTKLRERPFDVIINYSFLLASTKAVIQLALPDHQNKDRIKLNGPDSMYAYARAKATRLAVYHSPMPLMVSAGTPVVTASRTIINR